MIPGTYLSNDGKKWQLPFYPDNENYPSAPFIVPPKKTVTFSARFTQDCSVDVVSVFNREGFKITPDFKLGEIYSINERMKFLLLVENVSEVERIFDAVAFARIYMRK